MIYFSPPSVTRLLERFARALREGGSLVTGAAEVVFEPPSGLEAVTTGNRLVLRRPRRAEVVNANRLPPLRLGTESRPSTDRNLSASASANAAVAPAAIDTKPIEARTTTERNRILEVRATPTAAMPPLPVAPIAVTGPSLPPAPVPSQLPALGRAPTHNGALTAEEALVATLTRGHQLFQQGAMADAIRTYNSLTVRYSDVAEVWLFLGIAHYIHSEFDAAATALRACLCLDPALWPATFYLARAYEQLGQRADALQQYDLLAATDDLKPLSLRTGNDSVVINELRAYRHDLRNAARRVASDRGVSLRKLPPPLTPKDR
jgi:hypothetical protein